MAIGRVEHDFTLLGGRSLPATTSWCWCIRPKPSLELRIPQDFIMVVVVVVWLSLTGTLVLVVGTLELVVVSGFIFHCCVLVLIPDLISNK